MRDTTTLSLSRYSTYAVSVIGCKWLIVCNVCVYVSALACLFLLCCCSTLTQNIRERRGEKVAINIPGMFPIYAVVVVTYFVHSMVTMCVVLITTIE